MTRRQMLHSGRFSEIEKLGLNISQSPAEAITLDFNGVFVKWNEHTGWGFHHSCSIWYSPLLKRVSCCQLKAELLWWLILRFSELVRNLNISYKKSVSCTSPFKSHLLELFGHTCVSTASKSLQASLLVVDRASPASCQACTTNKQTQTCSFYTLIFQATLTDVQTDAVLIFSSAVHFQKEKLEGQREAETNLLFSCSYI